jgi:hypothetical protein
MHPLKWLDAESMTRRCGRRSVLRYLLGLEALQVFFELGFIGQQGAHVEPPIKGSVFEFLLGCLELLEAREGLLLLR